MPRYINADNLLEKLHPMIDYCEKDRKVNAVTALFQVGDAIMDCKTADVQEVRHGTWYWYDDGSECGWKCSCCDNYPDHDNYMADDYENKPNLKYCPNCGCKMDGSATDTNVGSRKE